jgi:hypothetical protein
MAKKANKKDQLIENVINFPNNLQAAFRLTARQTGQTCSAISAQYYGNGKFNKQGNINGLRHNQVMFLTHSQQGLLVNTKNTSAAKETKTILELETSVKALGALSNEDKVAFFDLIMGL